jgi:hypothetical protein
MGTNLVQVHGVVADHLRGVNSFDVDAVMATFADDAIVNDARREIRGRDAIRRWVAKEIVGDHVTIELLEVSDHYGDVVTRGRYDGDYDKSALPGGELVMSSYFAIRDGRIVTLAIINNRPSEYDQPE